MKHTAPKTIPVSITCNNEVIGLKLRPVTFRRLIDITDALGGKELTEVLLDPSPLQIATIAYCMLDMEDKSKIDKFALQINEKSVKVGTAQKLYYIVAENNVQDGYINYTSLIQAVNDNIISSFPQTKEDKKKILGLIGGRKSRWNWKRYLILLLLTTLIPLIPFLMK
jgi:hypothetical protein